MTQVIKSRVLRTDPIEWRKLEFLQADSFKDLSGPDWEKLKASVVSNDFSQPFYVWQDCDGTIYCLDGKHRTLILTELIKDGVEVPDELPATFIRCSDKKEAAELVLQYSSYYAKITEKGLLDFMESFNLSFDDVKLTVNFPELNMLSFGGTENEPSVNDAINEVNTVVPVSLVERFIVPPFSVLDTRQGYWQERKRAWHALGIDSQETREDIEIMSRSAQAPAIYELRNKMRAELGRDPNWDEILAEATERGLHLYGGASIFDPVLCEVLYTWFNIAGGVILDSFAGGSVRGIIAAKLGHFYHGIDLRPDQVEANRRQAEQMQIAEAEWYIGDSTRMDEVLSPSLMCDFFFSCPPYHDLEEYSEDPADLSNMDYAEFLQAYRLIIRKGVERLKDNRFACFVVGDLRDKTGAYRNFVGDTVQAFQDAGMMYYNEIILMNVAGSMPMRVNRQFTNGRKVGKVHQNVLVFFKGDPKTIKDNYPVLPTYELASEEQSVPTPEGVVEL